MISFNRTKYIGDFISDNIDITLSAETSKDAFDQFKKMLRVLDQEAEKAQLQHKAKNDYIQ